ncbi:type I restriction endonuclease subunit R [Geobacter sulfurreducens]|uniref:type I restriction endonuclease subunit R n=1 Tax=Geobacter sulfurreducens TaxID=35554 RepID=UPI002B61B3DA|nr:type I restriction endonuclease subunit R [Geobacter sulfurreducens]HML77356.1 type I restriction endonuclease subunit R [Geobacter sulfurreducens]
MPAAMTEDTLVQRTTADYLHDELGWDSVFAYNEETFGPEGTLGRLSDKEVILTRHLREALVKLNPGLPEPAYRSAISRITDYSFTQSPLQINREKYDLLKNGVPVEYRNERGEVVKRRLRVFEFDRPEENHFLIVRELWIKGQLYRRRADIIGFVNGIPLLFMELKNVNKEIRAAYEQNLADYKDTVPHLFHHNAVIVLANGIDAKIGSLSSRYEHFHEWKRLEETAPGVVNMETLLKGICAKGAFMDMFENFILFDDSSGKTVKIVARNHQFLGVNRAVQAVRDRQERLGKLGVFWHTQGSGKSYSMAFFTQKVHRKLTGSFTFLICTDRDDLDTQIYKTFAGCGLADNDADPCRASSGEHLAAMLRLNKPFVFSLIQKFNKDVNPEEPYSTRDDIIVISDEAHRTQYGRLALNLRNALPNASYIGFTGTPLFKDDEITRRVFGDYISTYDFQRAVDDKATVPLYYDARGEKLRFLDDEGKQRLVATDTLNEKIAAKLEELEIDDIDVAQRLEKELKREYHIITAGRRLDQIARDFVEHYSTQWETGKAMLVCIDKITCVRMFKLIEWYWTQRSKELEKAVSKAADEQEEAFRHRQIQWMKETRMAVVVSEEQGEVQKFKDWDLDIEPHRKLIKEGFETSDGKRIDMESAFKAPDHPFRIVIVCAMWLTGFDVPSLATLYLDKPLKAHTLMQAVARANRVYEGKNNGLIVDYCGILKNLRKALATFAGHQGGSIIDGGGPQPQVDPVKPEEELLADLAEAVAMVRGFLTERDFQLEEIIENSGFARNKAIAEAKEAVNENDETRKRFEIIAREVFKKFKACITVQGVNDYRMQYDAVNIIYKSLLEDRDNADITAIIRELHYIVDDTIATENAPAVREGGLFDISKIDFDRLRQEFERSTRKNSTVQCLKTAIDQRLKRMIQQNPLRTDFHKHYQEIIAAYNSEKDRATIERTFEELMKFVTALDEEEHRAIREGLDEESLAMFDLLIKPELSKSERERIKRVAKDLLEILKAEKLRIENWPEKEATRSAVRVTIRDFLYNEATGLPVSFYSDEEVETKTDLIYQHLFMQYRGGYGAQVYMR